MLKRFIFCFCCVVTVLAVGAMARAEEAAPKPPIRVSAWYWLNSAPKEDWEGDFVTMKHLGFSDVLLCWGLDLTGIVTRKAETKQAMELAHRAGIGVYLIVWQPHANSLPRTPEFVQVNTNGVPLTSFDVFNPKWRSTQWKEFLQDVAKTYGKEPAMAGYVFDDSFGSANVSYGPFEEKAFGRALPRKPEDPAWEEWTKMRQGWWEDWAKDTVGYIRAVDPNKGHEIYLEDIVSRFTDRKKQAEIGVDLARVAKYFDAVGGYTTPKWTDKPDSDEKVLKLTADAIEKVRNVVGTGMQIKYTFWSANIAEEMKPGAAVYPSAAQIRAVCEEALKHGVKHLDMYGYRIGEYRATHEEMVRMMPAEPKPYVLTGQFPQKFMWDRPEIHTELGAYLRGLNGEGGKTR